MIKKKKLICIIPARKGSKGLKNKNIKRLNNVPLMAWTILLAKKCKLIDDIIVSTDCTKISKIAKRWCKSSIYKTKKICNRQSKFV